MPNSNRRLPYFAHWMVAAIALLALASVALGSEAAPAPFRLIDEAELARLIASDRKLVVLDVRTPPERSGIGLRCRTCTTIRTPIDPIGSELADEAARQLLAALLRGSPALKAARRERREVAVLCLQGQRAETAARQLAALGLAPVVLAGGLSALTNPALIAGKRPKE